MRTIPGDALKKFFHLSPLRSYRKTNGTSLSVALENPRPDFHRGGRLTGYINSRNCFVKNAIMTSAIKPIRYATPFFAERQHSFSRPRTSAFLARPLLHPVP